MLAMPTSQDQTSNCHFCKPSTPHRTEPEWIPILMSMSKLNCFRTELFFEGSGAPVMVTSQEKRNKKKISRSKRPKSSLRVRTKSWADRFMDNKRSTSTSRCSTEVREPAHMAHSRGNGSSVYVANKVNKTYHDGSFSSPYTSPPSTCAVCENQLNRPA
ncbi:hypothetical protein EYF80_021164 [Liparis tanakae]|uniref:Uncharacterized protein n=1 Tax=Liparis tanakae TaxID=230148 RepID=A0A4Z2HSM3_9TELE|nr:hypothetical protein EYF80_021164 [Liparis tanakae]